MDSLKSIVVGVDFSPSSRDAVVQAQRLGRWTGASVRAVHVINTPAITPIPPVLYPFALPSVADLIGDAKERMAAFGNELEGTALPEVEFLADSPAEGIMTHVHKHRADLLVLGTHSVHDEQRGIGTTAGACVRRAPCKVLLVRRGQVGPFRTIVACVDFSDTSRLALDQAIRVAAQDDAVLHIVHVYNDPWSGWRSPAPKPAGTPDVQSVFNEAVLKQLRAFCEPSAHQLSAVKTMLHAVPHIRGVEGLGWGLVRFVQEQGVDLAVLGTRSKWNVRDMVFGSTAERVVRNARCSILAVKPAHITPTAPAL